MRPCPQHRGARAGRMCGVLGSRQGGAQRGGAPSRRWGERSRRRLVDVGASAAVTDLPSSSPTSRWCKNRQHRGEIHALDEMPPLVAGRPKVNLPGKRGGLLKTEIFLFLATKGDDGWGPYPRPTHAPPTHIILVWELCCRDAHGWHRRDRGRPTRCTRHAAVLESGGQGESGDADR